MSEWKLEVTLRQLTPLVHFQHAQPGATLRATEVKPKLDRFLLLQSADDKLREALIRADTGKKEREALKAIAAGHKDWCLPSVNENADPALDYKLRIEGSENVEIIYLHKRYGAYFNIGDRDALNSKKGVFDRGFIHLTIICFQEELRHKIQETIATFFAVQNFGFRQNKGFGSYKVIEINGQVPQRRQKELAESYVKLFLGQADLYEYVTKSPISYKFALDSISKFSDQMKKRIQFKNKINKELSRAPIPLYFLPISNDEDEITGVVSIFNKNLYQREIRGADNKEKNIKIESPPVITVKNQKLFLILPQKAGEANDK